MQYHQQHSGKDEGPVSRSRELSSKYKELYEKFSQPLLDRHIALFPDDDFISLIERIQIATLFAVAAAKENENTVSPSEIISRAIWCKAQDNLRFSLAPLFEADFKVIRELCSGLKPLDLWALISSLEQPKETIFTEYFLSGKTTDEIAKRLNLKENTCEELLLEITRKIGPQGSMADLTEILPDKDPIKKKKSGRPEKRDTSLKLSCSPLIVIAKSDPDLTRVKVPAKGGGEMDDFAPILNHRILSREEEFLLFKSFRENREQWLQCILRSPLVIERSIQVYAEAFDYWNSGSKEEKNEKVLKFFWRLTTEDRHEKKDEFIEAFPKVLSLASALKEIWLKAVDNNPNYEVSKEEENVIEKLAEIFRKFPLSYSLLNGFYEELSAYFQELSRTNDPVLAEELIYETGESPRSLRDRIQNLAVFHSNFLTAREEIAKNNQKLVFWSVKRFLGAGLPISDLLQEGNEGLLRSIDLFDPDFAIKFSTYAPHWIRQTARRAIADKARTIRLPVHVHDTAWRTLKEYNKNNGEHPQAPDMAKISEEYLKSPELTAFYRNKGDKVTSLDTPLEEGGSNIADFVPDSKGIDPGDDAADFEVFNKLVTFIYNTLEEREAAIILSRLGLGENGDYGNENTLEEVGRRYEVTRERIRQIEKTSLYKLREALLLCPDMLKLFKEAFNIQASEKSLTIDLIKSLLI